MNQGQIELLFVLVLTASACALPGVYLVLRRMALISDAIGHVLLFGIVLAYFLTQDLKSPWLLIGATLSGLATVALVELLQRSRLVKEDAAIGLVFPALFSLGILLASMYLRGTHLDVDAVLLGIPEITVNRRLVVNGYIIGPYSLIVLGVVFVLNLLFITLFHKELKLSTFDAGLAASFGFLPGLLHYLLMGSVSLTAVTAFDAVGPVLVVAFMVVPAATAYLLTDRLAWMLLLSGIIGAIGACSGTFVALHFNTTIAGTIATILGLQFALAFAFAPHRGLVAQLLTRLRQRREFYETMLLIHLSHHEGTPEQENESRIASLHEHLRWRPKEVLEVVNRLIDKELVRVDGGTLLLKEAGKRAVLEQMASLGIAL